MLTPAVYQLNEGLSATLNVVSTVNVVAVKPRA